MDAINIVFRFLDFFVIVGLVCYAVKQYVIPAVEKMLREYSVFIYNLESDCKDLQCQTQSIYENIQDQDRQFQLMQSRFLIWQKQCDNRLAAQKLEQQRIDNEMQNRFLVRSDFIKNDNAIKDQLPAILCGATKALQQKYNNTHVQKQYIDELIHIMKEKS